MQGEQLAWSTCPKAHKRQASQAGACRGRAAPHRTCSCCSQRPAPRARVHTRACAHTRTPTNTHLSCACSTCSSSSLACRCSCGWCMPAVSPWVPMPACATRWWLGKLCANCSSTSCQPHLQRAQGGWGRQGGHVRTCGHAGGWAGCARSCSCQALPAALVMHVPDKSTCALMCPRAYMRVCACVCARVCAFMPALQASCQVHLPCHTCHNCLALLPCHTCHNCLALLAESYLLQTQKWCCQRARAWPVAFLSTPVVLVAALHCLAQQQKHAHERDMCARASASVPMRLHIGLHPA